LDYTMSTGPVVRVLTDPPAVFAAAAVEFLQRARTAIQGSGRFTVALSGGSTPRNLYSLLATQSDVPWGQIRFFFSDERHVPPDSPDSNFRMAYESLFSRNPTSRRCGSFSSLKRAVFRVSISSSSVLGPTATPLPCFLEPPLSMKTSVW
jgi:Glucosamine-6-phosphate isomerases/6-phosphogluconolactonase